MAYLDLAALERTPLERRPYDHVIVERFVTADTFPKVARDFPNIVRGGLYPPSILDIRGHFKGMMDEIEGPAFRAAIERKFGLDLGGLGTMYTVRGHVRSKDGRIHTDAVTKIITVLVYLNEGWEHDGGRLRVLRSRDNLEDYAAEINPFGGTLLVFRRSDNSWHGHKPHEGPRRAIQFNWVTSQAVAARELLRHAAVAQAKRVFGNLIP
jgi:hypothetical protein